MTVKEAVSLLHYGTHFEIKGSYSGKIYHNTMRNKRKNIEKYYDQTVVDEPFFVNMAIDKEKQY